MPDYNAWDLTNDFTVAQASCLWCEVDPDISFLLQKSQNPQIAAIEQMLVSEIRAGRLPADSTKNPRTSIGDYSQSVVSREALEELAERKGVRPKFLFPAARQPSSEVQPRAKMEAARPSAPQGESVPAPAQAPAAEIDSASRAGAVLIEPVALEQEQVEGPGPGRKPGYNWDEFMYEVVRRAFVDGLPDTLAEAEKMMAEWCINHWGERPVDSTIRIKLSPLYGYLRSQGAIKS